MLHPTEEITPREHDVWPGLKLFIDSRQHAGLQPAPSTVHYRFPPPPVPGVFGTSSLLRKHYRVCFQQIPACARARAPTGAAECRLLTLLAEGPLACAQMTLRELYRHFQSPSRMSEEDRAMSRPPRLIATRSIAFKRRPFAQIFFSSR